MPELAQIRQKAKARQQKTQLAGFIQGTQSDLSNQRQSMIALYATLLTSNSF
jgi:hypothetical protein